MGRKTGRNAARRALPVFEALERREVLSRTLPIPLVPPGVRVVQSGQAFYEVRLSGPGILRVSPMGGGQFGVDLFGTTDNSTLSVTRTRVRPHAQVGSLLIGRIDVKSGQLGAIQAPVAVLQGSLSNVRAPIQSIALGGLGPRARVDLPGGITTLDVGVIQLGPSGLLHVGGSVGNWTTGLIELNGGQARIDGEVAAGRIGGVALRGQSQLVLGSDVRSLDVIGDVAILGGSTLGVNGAMGWVESPGVLHGLTVGGSLLVSSAGRFEVGRDVVTMGMGEVRVGPTGVLHVGGSVGNWTAGLVELNGGQARVDGDVVWGQVDALSLKGRSQLTTGGHLGSLSVLDDAAVVGGSRLEIDGALGGLDVGGSLLIASAGRFDIRQDVTGPFGVGDDLVVDAGTLQVGRDIQAASTIGDDLVLRGGGRLNVARDVRQPLHVVGDALFESGSGLLVDRNLDALRIDGNLDTTAGGVLRVGANLSELTVGGVIVGRGSLGSSIPDVRIGLNLYDLTVRGMLPNRGGIADADIDVIKSILGIDIRQGVFNSLITAGVLIDGGELPDGRTYHIGPDGTAAVQDSQIRAGANINRLVLNGDVVSTPGGIQPTRIVAGQNRDGSFRSAGAIDEFLITGSLIDAVIVASVSPTGGNGGFNPSPTWPASLPGEGYDAAIGYVTGGTLGTPLQYGHSAPGGYNEFGNRVGYFYDTTLDPVIDDVILSGAINASLVQTFPKPTDDPETEVPLPLRSTVLGGVYRTPGAVDFAGLFAADTRGVFVGRLPR